MVVLVIVVIVVTIALIGDVVWPSPPVQYVYHGREFTHILLAAAVASYWTQREHEKRA